MRKKYEKNAVINISNIYDVYGVTTSQTANYVTIKHKAIQKPGGDNNE